MNSNGKRPGNNKSFGARRQQKGPRAKTKNQQQHRPHPQGRQKDRQRAKPVRPDFAFDLYPLEGISGRGIKANFGDTRAQIITAFSRDSAAGRPVEKRPNEPGLPAPLSFYKNGLVIEFDEEDKVEFFEFVDCARSKLRPILDGIDLARQDAEKTLDILIPKIAGLDDEDAPYGYVFLRPCVSLYRESSPEDLADMERDHALGDRAARHEEELLAHRWASIGIGCAGYFDE